MPVRRLTMIRLITQTILVTWGLAGTALAAEQVLTLDPAATEIDFVLDAAGHKVRGKLFLVSGRIRFDLDSGAADGEVRIDARKADTGNKRRDKTMHKKVLESARYPLFVFIPTSVEGTLSETEASELTLVGTLSIHGDEHPFSIPVQVEQDGDVVSASATFIVPYADWGLYRPSVLFFKVAPEVEVRIEAKGSLSSAAGVP